MFSIGNVFQVEDIQWWDKESLRQVKLILQKHLQYRSNFGIESANKINRKFVLNVSWKV